MIWYRQENTRLDVVARVGAFGKLQRERKWKALVSAELQPLSVGMSWRVGESPRDGIRN